MPVLYHAPGGGLGHAVRTLALARQLARLTGGTQRVVVNTPLAPALVPEPGVDLIAIPPATPAAGVAAALQRLIAETRPDLFVADTFPRGVGGELAELLGRWSSCPRVLVARTLPPAYVRRHHLTGFVRRHYDLILGAGEPHPFVGCANCHDLPPFHIRDADELSPVAAAALVRSPVPVVLVAATGTAAECAEWAAVAAMLRAGWPPGWPPLRLAVPNGIALPACVSDIAVRHFPLIECLPAVRLVVGNAGYNLVHEAAATGTAGVFVPRRRRYDDQAARLGYPSGANSAGVEAARLRAAIARKLAEPPPSPSAVVNGARLAAGLASALLIAAPRGA
jgi:predicted glycosyltransferase